MISINKEVKKTNGATIITMYDNANKQTINLIILYIIIIIFIYKT